jgi:hypothetical protein
LAETRQRPRLGEYEKPGFDPRSKQPTVSLRRRIRRELELPIKEAYAAWLNAIFDNCHLMFSK